MTSDQLTADLNDEVRRLRIRISALRAEQLAAPLADGSGSARAAIRATLTDLATLTAPGPTTAAHTPASFTTSDTRAVPDLGDGVLADQIVVLLNDCLPSNGADLATTGKALSLARALRTRLNSL